MKAVVFRATRDVVVEDVEDARIERDDDVVVRLTSSALCGTDLHMYRGVPARHPARCWVTIGGVLTVEAAGPAVQRVRRGDRVVLPAHIYCGVCFNCSRGDSAPACGCIRGTRAVRTPCREWARSAGRRRLRQCARLHAARRVRRLRVVLLLQPADRVERSVHQEDAGARVGGNVGCQLVMRHRLGSCCERRL